MSKRLLDLLQKAYKLIRNKKCWIQGVNAVSQTGKSCYPKSQRACKWCSRGALLRFSRENSSFYNEAYEQLKLTIYEKNASYGLMSYNDIASHKQVMEVWKETIDRIKNVKSH